MTDTAPTFDYGVTKTWNACGDRLMLQVDFQGREYLIDLDDPRIMAFVLTYTGDPGMVRLSEPIYEFQGQDGPA